ncbi:hypothetical protein RN02_01480 [Pseudomonas sp. PI1]|nr:hypothetical protein RN02_01480 [Pseudomonas sp. PI1]
MTLLRDFGIVMGSDESRECPVRAMGRGALDCARPDLQFPQGPGAATSDRFTIRQQLVHTFVWIQRPGADAIL